ncbi:DUF1769-domain-containing protein [Ceratobasidium sp. AG-I]|nr:DUF1769-domain-containing protein [Ceratobasidium sp. AG-I]
MMAPLLKVSVGPNVDSLKEVPYNDYTSHEVRSAQFDGMISVHIKDEEDIAKGGKNAYFDHESRTTSSWSICIQGRFLEEINANDILFGNMFDKPLSLPWGFGAALNFVQYADPTLEHDLYGEKPWSLSPLLSTMPYLERTHLPANTPVPKIPAEPLEKEESKPALASALESDTTPVARRKYFADEAHRKEVVFTPEDLIRADFVHGHLRFPSLTFSLPGGLQFDLMSYYDGRPVHFVCKERGTEGKTFFVVSFTVVKDGEAPDEPEENNDAPVDSSDID